MVSKEGKLIRQRYSRAEGYNGIYADEKDTQGEILYNVAEVQKMLMKTDELDMSEEGRKIGDKNIKLFSDCRVAAKPCDGQLKLKENLGKEKILVDLLSWFSRTIPVSKSRHYRK
jgi:hypothetical protein